MLHLISLQRRGVRVEGKVRGRTREGRTRREAVRRLRQTRRKVTMKTLLAATALTLLVTPPLAETPCNAKLQALQKQRTSLPHHAPPITDTPTAQCFHLSNRFHLLTPLHHPPT